MYTGFIDFMFKGHKSLANFINLFSPSNFIASHATMECGLESIV